MALIPFAPKTTGTLIPFNPKVTGSAPVPTAPKTLQGTLDSGGYADKVGGQELAGFNKIKSSISKGAQDFNAPASKNPVTNLENTGKTILDAGFGTIAGATQIVGAGLEPALAKLKTMVTPALRAANPDLAKVYDSIAPKISSLAQAHPEAATRIGDVVNALIVGFGGEAAPDTSTASATLKGDLGSAADTVIDKVEGTTPEKLNDYIDRKYSRAIPSSSKKSLALTDKQLENNRESLKLVNDNKANLEYSNQAGTYDKGRLPENIVEHAQAVTQTRQSLWDKMTSALKDKNVMISLEKPLAQIEAKIKELGESASETPYLKALYDKYSKTRMATVDQMNTFIKDLNNDAEPFFRSGSDKPKAASSASVGNLFRDQLDTTAQQLGSPEVSLLRKQYGAMASAEGDIAKALNKQLKGGAGGASGLADLFSGEEIGRGIITGNPASIVSGLSLQATKGFLKWLNNPNRTLKNLYSTIESVSEQGGVPRMESSFAPKERAGLPALKGNPNTADTPSTINLPGKIGGFDEPQAQNIGIRTTPPTPVKVPDAPKGNFLNIGMNEGTTSTKITESQMKSKLESALPKDVKVTGYKVVKDPTEDTFVPTLSRPLTDTEMAKVLKATGQKAIPQLSNGVGTMHGSDEWGDFNKEYFKGVNWNLTGSIKNAIEKKTENITAYHGSPDPNVIFKGSADFTDNLSTAKDFSNAKDRGGLLKGEKATIYKKQLSIKNPKIITSEREYEKFFQTTKNGENIKDLIRQGYDGIIYKPSGGGDTYYKVFSEKQIK